MKRKLSHISETGSARMVDVSAKSPTRRRAVAEGFVTMQWNTWEALKNHTGPKGEVFPVARIAGIQAAKKTGELIPLCHPLPVEHVVVDFDTEPTDDIARDAADGGWKAIRILATATITAKTGVEMEALTAVAVAALTIIDMLKALDPAMHIDGIRLLEKTGGKSHYRAKHAAG
jgi:cyclic pyranopterin monophosphate synthase